MCIRDRIEGAIAELKWQRGENFTIKQMEKTRKSLEARLDKLLAADKNIQREELLPSEKAFAYKMKLEAMKRKAGRPSKGNTGQIVPNLTTDIIGETEGISGRQVKRFIRLTELIPELLDLVDNKKLQFTVACLLYTSCSFSLPTMQFP